MKSKELVQLVKDIHNRQLTKSQLACVATDLLPAFRREAKRRQLASRARPGEKIGWAPRTAPFKARSDAQAAEVFGVSRGYVAEARRLRIAYPNLFVKVREGIETLQRAKAEMKEKT